MGTVLSRAGVAALLVTPTAVMCSRAIGRGDVLLGACRGEDNYRFWNYWIAGHQWLSEGRLLSTAMLDWPNGQTYFPTDPLNTLVFIAVQWLGGPLTAYNTVVALQILMMTVGVALLARTFGAHPLLAAGTAAAATMMPQLNGILASGLVDQATVGLCALTVATLVRLLRQPGAARLVALVACGAALLLSSPNLSAVMALLMGPPTLVWLAVRGRGRRLWTLAAGALIGLIGAGEMSLLRAVESTEGRRVDKFDDLDPERPPPPVMMENESGSGLCQGYDCPAACEGPRLTRLVRSADAPSAGELGLFPPDTLKQCVGVNYLEYCPALGPGAAPADRETTSLMLQLVNHSPIRAPVWPLALLLLVCLAAAPRRTAPWLGLAALFWWLSSADQGLVPIPPTGLSMQSCNVFAAVPGMGWFHTYRAFGVLACAAWGVAVAVGLSVLLERLRPRWPALAAGALAIVAGLALVLAGVRASPVDPILPVTRLPMYAPHWQEALGDDDTPVLVIPLSLHYTYILQVFHGRPTTLTFNNHERLSSDWQLPRLMAEDIVPRAGTVAKLVEKTDYGAVVLLPGLMDAKAAELLIEQMETVFGPPLELSGPALVYRVDRSHAGP